MDNVSSHIGIGESFDALLRSKKTTIKELTDKTNARNTTLKQIDSVVDNLNNNASTRTEKPTLVESPLSKLANKNKNNNQEPIVNLGLRALSDLTKNISDGLA